MIICWKDVFLWIIVNSNSFVFESNSCCTEIRKYIYVFLCNSCGVGGLVWVRLGYSSGFGRKEDTAAPHFHFIIVKVVDSNSNFLVRKFIFSISIENASNTENFELIITSWNFKYRFECASGGFGRKEEGTGIFFSCGDFEFKCR